MRNLALALFLSTAIAGCGSHDHGAAMDTPLDKILVMGHDTQGAWKQFMHDGGLQASDQWRGYTVQNVSLGYDAKDRLSEISLVLSPGTDNKTPSFKNISRDLAGLCGTSWRKGKPSTAENGKILCIFSPSKMTGYYRLEINKMEGMGVPGL